MTSNNKRIVDIGKSIRNQVEMERRNRGQRTAIARYDVDMVDTTGEPITHLWIARDEYRPTPGRYIQDQKEEGSMYVTKNSNVGVLLTSKPFGTYPYKAKNHLQREVERSISFSTKATFTSGIPVKNLAIQVEGQPIVRFDTIDDILCYVDEIDKQLEKKRLKEEAAAKEVARLKAEQEVYEAQIAKTKAEEAERFRIQEELLKQEELKRIETEEIQRLEEQHAQALELIHETNHSFLSGREMRYQEIMDVSQTQAKISHLFDGVPIVIDGGPGTGKTTTFIQRLKFLTDPLLSEHETCCLNQTQIEKLTDYKMVKNHWVFISPSDLLAQYLKNAISIEGLSNDTANVIPFEKFLKNHLRNYQIAYSISDSKPAFRSLNADREFAGAILISDGQAVISAFEKFIISQISKVFQNTLNIKTSGFSWQKSALGIQHYCKRIGNVKSLQDLVRLLNNLQDNEIENVKSFNEKLKTDIEIMANRLRKQIMNEPGTVEYLSLLFDDWSNDNNQQESEEVDVTEEEEPTIQIDKENVDSKVYQELKKLLKKLALRKFDSSLTLSKYQKDFYEGVQDYVDKEDLSTIAELAWFQKNFASLCRGTESLLLSKILRLYKAFRREQLKLDDSVYDKGILKELVSKNENRDLHRDEQSLLLGFINHFMLDLHKMSPEYFDKIKHPFAQAYRDSIKYVIGVDEASDYSPLDFYCIASFAHYEFSAITLCGDIMQGLGNNSLSSWESLKEWIFPKLEIFSLKKSYRQWPTLLEVSKRMYQDDRKCEAPYDSALQRRKHEAKPLAFVSADKGKKIDWIANRIDEVYRHFNSLPSIAIFLNENEDVNAFISRLKENDCMDAFDIDDCTHGSQGRDDSIRVFYLSKVKGMEFEAAFFHNIDSSHIENEELRRRYLYVGISRAISHLGATFSSAKSDVLKYFETDQTWRM
ncbi:MAG: ATP-binding domain-containing protein [Bacteroidales bacterium]|nr:ATP-binding domain-containing protein [Bacteroidales bacterium]